MEYLRILDVVRAVTGGRSERSFPDRPEPIVAVREAEAGQAVLFVHEAALAKGVLESPRYRQFHFLARILEVADPRKTSWIRRFCDVGLIMIDGPEHLRRREAMNEAMEACIRRLQRWPPEAVAAALEPILRTAQPPASHVIARDLVALLFSECIAAIAGGSTQALEAADLVEIDFFNPFPTLSTLYRCNASIERVAVRVGLDAMTAAQQAAVLSLLIMGVSPMQGIFTVALNRCAEALQAGGPLDDALAALKSVDAYSVVPTNFVMRLCVDEDAIGGNRILPGDIVYLFLGTASGCPFSRQNSVPFGAGAHYCSGAKITSVLLNLARQALAAAGESLRRVEPSEVVHGKAHAFLMHRDRTVQPTTAD